MKGGKRITEEARVEWFGFVHAQNKRITTPERRLVICKEIIDDLEAWLERDDEPEYCIWEEHSVFKGFFHPSCEENRASHYPGVDDIKFCPYCGKPVKEE